MALSECYPAYSETLKVRRVELRYLDAFPLRKSGLTYSELVRKAFHVTAALPQSISQQAGDEIPIDFQGEFTFPILSAPGRQGVIKIASGVAREEPSVILEVAARSFEENQSTVPADLLACFDQLHVNVRSWFEELITDEMRQSFGAKREV